MRAREHIVLVTLTLIVATACSSPVCTPGKTESCSCPGTTVTGVQTCDPNGGGFGTCTGCPSGGTAGGSGGGVMLGQPCDTLSQNCAAGLACVFPQGPDPVCQTAGSLAAGATCTASANTTSCQRGLQCASSTCSTLCNRGSGPPMCPAGKTCASATGFPSTVGLCN